MNASQRRNMALELRIRGYSQARIAEEVGVSQSAVSKMIRKALAERQAERVDDLREIEGERLERLHAAMWKPAIEQGNTGAAHVVLKASERRSKLLGLDLGKEDGAGGVLRHDYFAMVTIATTDEADAAFARMRAEVDADAPYMRAEEVVDTTAQVGASVRDFAQAQEQAIAAVRATIPAEPGTQLVMRVIVLSRSYQPSATANNTLARSA